jgi:HD domain
MWAADLAEGTLPSREQAQQLAREVLGDQGSRLAHVLTAGRIARAVGEHLRERGFLTPTEAHLLAVAATVHDIGYAPTVARTGFHAYDGAAYLRSLGWSPRLVRLVANHSCALVTAPRSIVPRLQLEFPAEQGVLPDALAYSDMHSSPVGLIIAAEARLADIARRRPDPVEAARAVQLRMALARVGDALVAPVRAEVSPPLPRDASTAQWQVAPDLRAC